MTVWPNTHAGHDCVYLEVVTALKPEHLAVNLEPPEVPSHDVQNLGSVAEKSTLRDDGIVTSWNLIMLPFSFIKILGSPCALDDRGSSNLPNLAILKYVSAAGKEN